MDLEQFKQYTRKAEAVLEKEIFFIVGYEKSGTTWLQQMLNAHPAICCVGEGHYMHGLAKPMVEACNEYNGLITQTNRVVYKDSDISYRAPDQDDFHAWVLFQAFSMLVEAPPKEARFFGDKTPNHIIYMHQLKKIFPKAKFFHIYRDGRDCLVSYLKHMQRSSPDKDYTYENSVERIATSWRQRIMLARYFAKDFPDSYYELKYENLLAQPHKELKSMHKFLGLKSTNKEIDACVEASSFEKLSGGRKAGEENTESFYRKGVAGDWVNELPEDILEQFMEVAGDAIQAMGYEQDLKKTGS